jgi:3-phenylpropionate/cinnamic acid dioxygenase small subunit
VETNDERMTIAPDIISFDDALRFIWAEAEMLDAHSYDAWLRLWTANGLYIVPVDRSAKDYASVLNVAYDDAEMREARVRRLKSGFSMSAAPPARTIRTISRFVVQPSPTYSIRAAQHIIEYKYDRTRMMAGDVTYELALEAGVIKLNRKVVQLINSDDALYGIGYLF